MPAHIIVLTMNTALYDIRYNKSGFIVIFSGLIEGDPFEKGSSLKLPP